MIMGYTNYYYSLIDVKNRINKLNYLLIYSAAHTLA